MPDDFTKSAVLRQIDATKHDLFEVGVFDSSKDRMTIRVWDRENIEGSISWLKWKNAQGQHIYARPQGENSLSLVDDLSASAVDKMRKTGYQPSIVVETSPNNFQAWVNHGKVLDEAHETAAAKALAEKFGGDVNAASRRHFGRLAGFTNRKEKYGVIPDFDTWRQKNFTYIGDGEPGGRDLWQPKGNDTERFDGKEYAALSEEGLRGVHSELAPKFPYVKLHVAEARVYDAAEEFIWTVNKSVDHQQAVAARAQDLWRIRSETMGVSRTGLKNIDDFRHDPRYAGDLSRADQAYAVYARSRGLSNDAIRAAIFTRDLKHKGGLQQQRAYADRTIAKAERGLGR